MRPEEIIASVSLTLGIPVSKIAEAIQIAVEIKSGEAGICSVCGKPITYQSEYEYWYEVYKNGLNGCWGYPRNMWESCAQEHARGFRRKRVRCSRCHDLVREASYFRKDAEQFFNTLAVAGSIAASTLNAHLTGPNGPGGSHD